MVDSGADLAEIGPRLVDSAPILAQFVISGKFWGSRVVAQGLVLQTGSGRQQGLWEQVGKRRWAGRVARVQQCGLGEKDLADDDEGGNDEWEDRDDRSDVAYAAICAEEAYTCQRGFGIFRNFNHDGRHGTQCSAGTPSSTARNGSLVG